MIVRCSCDAHFLNVKSRLLPFPRSPFVSPPAQFVTAVFGTRCDVRPAVAVEVGDDDLIRAAPVVLQHPTTIVAVIYLNFNYAIMLSNASKLEHLS